MTGFRLACDVVCADCATLGYREGDRTWKPIGSLRYTESKEWLNYWRQKYWLGKCFTRSGVLKRRLEEGQSLKETTESRQKND